MVTDDQIRAALDEAGLGAVLARAGGLDGEHDWSAILSLGEQQLLALTRLTLTRPAFAMLDRPDSALKPAQVRQALRHLDEKSITYITFAGDDDSADTYDAVLGIDTEGGWTWKRTGRGTGPLEPHSP